MSTTTQAAPAATLQAALGTLASRRVAAAAWLQRGAMLSFAALIVLSPLHARFDLVSRPVGTLYVDYTDVQIAWSDIALLLTLALWGTSLLLQRRRVWLGPRFLSWPVAALIAASFLTAPFSVDPVTAVITSVHLVVFAALGVYVCNQVGGLQRLVAPVAVMLTVQSVTGIGQVVSQRSLGLDGLGEHVLAPLMQVSVITSADGTRILRAYGLTDHPNILGGLLAMGLLLVGGMAAIRAARSSPIIAVVCALAAAALLVTFSRGAWVALLAGVAVLGGMLLGMHDRPALRRLGAVSAAALIMAMPFVLPYRGALAARTNPARVSATEVRSVDERAALAQATTALISAHPLAGVGAGGVPEAMRTADPSFRYTYQPASVVLLDVTAETGLLGGTAYMVLLVTPWLALLLRRSRWTPELAVASAALAALSVVGLFDYYTWTYSAGRVWAWVVLGLWAVAWRRAMAGGARAH